MTWAMASPSAWLPTATGKARSYSSPISAVGPDDGPLSGIRSAEGFTPENRPAQGPMLDQHPSMPAGPVGKQVLFVGSSLRADCSANVSSSR